MKVLLLTIHIYCIKIIKHYHFYLDPIQSIKYAEDMCDILILTENGKITILPNILARSENEMIITSKLIGKIYMTLGLYIYFEIKAF